MYACVHSLVQIAVIITHYMQSIRKCFTFPILQKLMETQQSQEHNKSKPLHVSELGCSSTPDDIKENFYYWK